jgi:nitrate reductase molybdenum cofactor assembly chaperone
LYEVFADLLTYPRADYYAHVHECAAIAPAECARDIAEFATAVTAMRLEDVQENFSAVFELNPGCTLDLGWHLFGDKYERGLLLARMRRELRRHGIDETDQLPDHLTHALRLLASMDRREAEDFAGAIVLPALAKLMPATVSQQPFGKVLNAVGRYVRAEYRHITFDEPARALPVLTEAA